MPALPSPRGTRSRTLIESLSSLPHQVTAPPAPPSPDPLTDEDLQLALYCCYELHYRGFDDVDPGWEWEPSLLAFRRALEREFEGAIREAIGAPQPPGGNVDVALREVVADDDGPSLSGYLQRRGTVADYLEFLVHRSAYQLKEADPHSWAIPRLDGAAKAALLEIQVDEYGDGRPERMHARLFADVLDSVGLDSDYGAYLDRLPAATLATVNLMSLFGLHRRLRGAICGHLAAFEMTSSIANARYARGLRRLGLDADRTTAFFDEHVEADAVHEQVAAVDLAGGLAGDEPALADDIVWGARALMELERRWSAHVLSCWEQGRSSLRRPQPSTESPVA